MSILGTSVVTVKQAAAALGVNVRTIEEHLRNGQLKGEKRQILFRDRWFVHKSQVDSLVASFKTRQEEVERQDFSPTANVDPPPAKDAAPFKTSPMFDKAKAFLSAPPVDYDSEHQQTLRLVSQEFGSCLQQSFQLINELRNELRVRDFQLQELPRLKRRIAADHSALQLINGELAASRKQITELHQQLAAFTLAKAQIKELEQTVAHLSRPWWQKLFDTLNQPI